MMFKRKKKKETLAQAVARFKLNTPAYKLGKKDLEIEIGGRKFYFIDMSLRRKD